MVAKRYVVAVAALALFCFAPTAQAGQGPTKDLVSNMGYCSAQLAKLPGELGLAPTARAEVNRILKVAGPTFGVSSPGELYRVRARTTVAQDDQCQRRNPPPPVEGSSL